MEKRGYYQPRNRPETRHDIQSLFKETIAEFIENGLEAELDEDLGYSKYDYKNKATDKPTYPPVVK